MNTKRSRYWLFWWTLIVLIGYSVFMSGAASWSHTMKKHMGLGFADDVTSPVIAMELAGRAEAFQDVLGIPAKDAAASELPADAAQSNRSYRDLENDIASAQKLVKLDFGFLALYTLALLLVLWHFTTTKVVGSKPLVFLLALLPIAMAVADVVENLQVLKVLDHVARGLETATAEVLKAQENKPEVRTRVEAALADAATESSPSKATWKSFHDKKIILLSGDGEDPLAIEKDARVENLPASLYEAVVSAKTAGDKLETLKQSGYILIKGELPTSRMEKMQEAIKSSPAPEPESPAPPQPSPPTAQDPAPTAKSDPQAYIMEALRQACQVVDPVMRKASLTKWGLSGLLFVVLGWVMLKRRVRRTARPAPRVSWCLAGVLMITGGLTVLSGTFLWPICIEAGFLFIMGAFVPLFIGGVKLATARLF